MVSLYNALKLTGDFQKNEYIIVKNIDMKNCSDYMPYLRQFSGSPKDLASKVDLRKIQCARIEPWFLDGEMEGYEYICR